MKQVVQIILSCGIGIVIGYFVGCGQKVKNVEKEVIVTKYDTVKEQVQVKIPDPKIKYVFLTDTVELQKIDSVFTEIIHNIEDGGPIPVNEYQDTITTENYQLRYNIQTIGFLDSFNYDLNVYRQTEILLRTKKPKWTVGLGLSNQLNYKLGAGYKGWMIESEFQKNKFHQIWLGKQFNF